MRRCGLRVPYLRRARRRGFGSEFEARHGLRDDLLRGWKSAQRQEIDRGLGFADDPC